MLEIKKIKAKEILDSRSEPTVEAEVETELGVFQASVPSGISRGKYEAVELRDGVKNINEIIGPKLKGKDVSQQKEIDEFLIKLDGTENKSSLGANAILGVSIAVCRAGAAVKKNPLYQYISQIFHSSFQFPVSSFKIPKPCFNILNGGVHADNDLDIQEFMIVPQTEIFQENLRIGTEIYHSLKKILKNKFEEEACNLGVEGGFAPPFKKTKEALDLIIEAIKEAGYEGKVKIGLDCAASHFFQEGKYNFEEKKRTGEELLRFYQDLLKEYPISFLEDPFEQDDWKPWQILRGQTLIIGDDLTVTNLKRIKQAKEKKACNGIILKPNQIGTVTETIAAAKLAKKFGWKIIVSHRSGETLDDFIADFAVGIGAEFIKSGAPGPAERMAKYNRLLKIEEELTENSSL